MAAGPDLRPTYWEPKAPGHAIWAGVMGYYATIRLDKKGPALIGGFLLAVFLHGAYDMAIVLNKPLVNDGKPALALALLAVPLAIIIGGAIVLPRMASKALAADDAVEAAARGNK